METEDKPKEAEQVAEEAEKCDTDSTSSPVAGDAKTQDSRISNGDDADSDREMVDLKIIWNKNKYDLKIPVDNTGAQLKERIHSLTGRNTVAPPPPPHVLLWLFRGIRPSSKTRLLLSRVLLGLPPSMQKVMYKGLLTEDKTLREIKITNGAKIMVVGSTINDVLAVNTPKEVIQQEVKAEEDKKEPLCSQKVRRIADSSI